MGRNERSNQTVQGVDRVGRRTRSNRRGSVPRRIKTNPKTGRRTGAKEKIFTLDRSAGSYKLRERDPRKKIANVESLARLCFGGSARLFCSLGVRAGVPNQIGPTSAQIRHGQRPSATVGAAIALPTVHGVDTGRVLLIEAVALGCSGPCVPLVRRRQPAPGAIYCAPSWGQKDLSPVAEAIGLRPTQPRQAPPRRFDSMDGVVPGRDRQGPQRASRSVRGSG